MKKDLRVSIKEIKGTCPVYKKADTFFIRKGYILDAKGQDICMHSLSSLMPFYNSLSIENITPALRPEIVSDFGVAKRAEKMPTVLDPWQPLVSTL